ncbi:carbohydrate ABC transporter membrane protein 2 (CUT1 family) [Haloactinopolyspora alba]|uniref:Carbohydrate ABC transporter membrane protein 2 (CUT1 family) n=1 Tax=Haloactinopolyspora alba TaxID=648780 RepID=A0A2P8E960_9ACTN|nr:carbohydrate ABC transporter permease [Haloactinopolyspora alba]PSL06011.1 carbohydrate ABC transporter membrane protein 2 (CUT1 family) [Haloactinopolyspora alba]
MSVDTVEPGPTARYAPSRRRGQGRLMVGILLLCFFTVTPFLAVVVLALTPEGVLTIPHAWPSDLTLDNITQILQVGDFPRWFANSFIYAAVSVVIILLTAAMAGYALARKRFPGRNVILWSIIATLMVPLEATLIPLFILVKELGGIDTLWGLILPTLANAQAVFLMRQFIMGLPDELFDAARIDGAGEWRMFTRIVLPLIRPIVATLGIFIFLWHWNDLLWPLIVGQSDEARTLTVGLATLNTEDVSTTNIMAAALVSVVPCLVVYAVLQRYIVDSIVATGIKG